MKDLPIGIQTFADLITGGFTYVDKTTWIHEMVRPAKGVFFLSRPRRFGKSLLVSTLKALFEGRRELFASLAIDALPYDWKAYPVLHVDFSRRSFTNPEDVQEWLLAEVDAFCAAQGVKATRATAEDRLREALEDLGRRGMRTVVLVDEYDKPLLDHIENPDTAVRMRDLLKGFYGSLKSSDACLRFVFLTGVSKFAKMNVFSGLNNLLDLTLHPRFATMLGYTQGELESCFPDRIDALAKAEGVTRERCLDKIRDWYNGYRFSAGAEQVYNPFSTLLLLNAQRFANYWFETGTPTFLLKLIRKALPPEEIGTVRLGAAAFSVYEPERLTPYPLLFQTGYLTIADSDPAHEVYRLDYPNREVRQSFLESLVSEFSGVETEREAGYRAQMVEALERGDLEGFFETMSVFFANIPYDIQIRSEKYYQSIFYLVFSLLGLRVEAEVRTNRGRIDAVAHSSHTVYVFEFKLDGTADEALAQCRENDYARRYRGQRRKVLLVGVPFDTATRNLGAWRAEPA